MDRVAGVLSTDSRWSILSNDGEWLAFVDDTDYDKLVCMRSAGFLFAGDLPLIDAWKQYVLAGMKKGTRPEVIQRTKISVIQVDLTTGDIVFQSHKMLRAMFGSAVRAVFAGTGAEPAKDCWDKNKCAVTAITSASAKDKRSGGKVVYLRRSPRGGNEVNTTTADQVMQIIKDRGFLMNTSNAQPVIVPITTAANDASNLVAQAFANEILSGGSAPLSAPFPGMDEPWSDETVAEFERVLSLYEED